MLSCSLSSHPLFCSLWCDGNWRGGRSDGCLLKRQRVDNVHSNLFCLPNKCLFLHYIIAIETVANLKCCCLIIDIRTRDRTATPLDIGTYYLIIYWMRGKPFPVPKEWHRATSIGESNAASNPANWNGIVLKVGLARRNSTSTFSLLLSLPFRLPTFSNHLHRNVIGSPTTPISWAAAASNQPTYRTAMGPIGQPNWVPKSPISVAA